MQNFNATTNSDGVYKATEKLLNGNYRAVAKYVSPNGDVLSEEVVFSIDVPDTYTITGNTSVNERTATVSGNLTQISNDLNNGNPVANAEVIFHLVSGTGSPDTILTITNENGDYTLELRGLENGSYVAYVEYTSPTNGYVARTPNLNFVVDVAPVKELTLNLDSKDEKGLLTFSGYLTDNGSPLANKTIVVRFSNGQGTVTTITDAQGNYTATKTIQVNGDYVATAEFSVSGQNTIYSNPVSFTIAIDTTPEITLTGSVGEYPKGREVTLTATVSNIFGKLTNQPVNFYRNVDGVDTLLGTVNTDSSGVAIYTATNVPNGSQTFVAKTTKDVVTVDSNVVEVEVTQPPSILFEIISIPISDSEARITGKFIVDGKPTMPSNAKLNLLKASSGYVEWSEDIEFNIDGTFDVTLTNPLADGTTIFQVQAEAYHEQVWMSNVVSFNAKRWQFISAPQQIPVYSSFTNNDQVVIITTKGIPSKIHITEDMVNFSEMTIADSTNIVASFSINGNLFLIEDGTGYIHKSSDNGKTWIKEYHAVFLNAKILSSGAVAVNGQQVMVADYRALNLGGVLKSTDGGLNWKRININIAHPRHINVYKDGFAITNVPATLMTYFLNSSDTFKSVAYPLQNATIYASTTLKDGGIFQVKDSSRDYVKMRPSESSYSSGVVDALSASVTNRASHATYLTGVLQVFNLTGSSFYSEDDGKTFKLNSDIPENTNVMMTIKFKSRAYGMILGSDKFLVY